MGIEEIEQSIPSFVSIHHWKYDKSVSFRGEDIRKTFAVNLFHALEIYYFQDNDKVEAKIITASKLLEATRYSTVSLAVFTARLRQQALMLERVGGDPTLQQEVQRASGSAQGRGCHRRRSQVRKGGNVEDRDGTVMLADRAMIGDTTKKSRP